MSSILKILVDIECQVYCDYELKGTAFPNSILRIEMRKGNYILEFKKDNTCLLTQEYEMNSNDEEQMLRVSLGGKIEKYDREKKAKQIESIYADIEYDDKGAIIVNKETGETFHLHTNRLFGGINFPFDACGLVSVPNGDQGNKWGCVNKIGEIQIPIIFDEPIRFKTPNVTVARLNGNSIFINKWGESIYESLYDIIADNEPFCDGFCIIADKSRRYGIIDSKGGCVLPMDYSSIIRCWPLGKWTEGCYLVKKDGRLGFFTVDIPDRDPCYGEIVGVIKSLDLLKSIKDRLKNIDKLYIEGSFLYCCENDDIKICDDYVKVIRNGATLFLDYDGNVLLKGYEIIPYQYRDGGQIVKKHGKYGCLNFPIYDSSSATDFGKLQEIIPCEYDCLAWGDMQKVSDKNLRLGYEVTKKVVEYFGKQDAQGNIHYYIYSSKGELLDDALTPNPGIYYMFIDTETTGLLPVEYKDKDYEYLKKSMPFLVQVAVLFYDINFNKLSERSIIVAPDGYIIPSESAKIHGITNDYALKHGETRKQVMKYLKAAFNKAVVIIGHNIEFDLSVISTEIDREVWSDGICGWLCPPMYDFGDDIDHRYYKADIIIDTMKLGADICKIPSTKKGEKYKWPKLDELYRALFGKSFQGQHNAMNDVRATEECFEELRRRKLIK